MRPKLQKTTDYNLFELHPCNRPERRDKKLAESLSKYGYIAGYPLVVRPNGNGKLLVVSGHHRLAEAKRQGLPVWYINLGDASDIDIFDIEGSSHPAWKPSEFAEAYSRAGKDEYKKLLWFKDKHGINLTVAASLVGGQGASSHNKTKSVKDGTFKVGDMIHAKEVVHITDLCREVGIKFATQNGFVRAVSMVLRIPEFDADTFASKISQFPKLIGHCSRTDEYLEEIETIYNYRARGKRMPVAFRAKEVAMIRCKSFGKTSKGSLPA